MKLLFILLFLISTSAYNQNAKVFFIASDSISFKEDYIYSRVLIIGQKKFRYPADLVLNRDSSKSNFGVIQLETFDSVKNAFVSFWPQVSQYFYPRENSSSTNIGSNLNFSFSLVGRPVLKHGLYRARIKIPFSRYNMDWQDVTSNWSYFYVE